MGNFIRRKIDTIFVMLGNGCNMRCEYCLQRPLVHSQITQKINPKIYDFIQEVQEESGELNLHFFGGEPLIYFNNIREIVENTENVTYSIITNGRAMTDEMVEFFNAHQFPVTISWDGRRVLETRGFDSFDKRKPLRRRLMRLNQLGISAVISSKAYPKETLEAIQEISDEYYKLHKYQARINCDLIFDTGIPHKELLDFDYQRVSNEMKEMTENYINSIKNGKQKRTDYAKNAYISNLMYLLSSYINNRDGVYDLVWSKCGNGWNVLNMDLDGNLYPCHNTSEAIGTIETPYFKYLKELLQRDDTKIRQSTCKVCPAVPLCNGGCKLVNDEIRNETYCKLRKAMFLPVIQAVQDFGKSVIQDGNS